MKNSTEEKFKNVGDLDDLPKATFTKMRITKTKQQRVGMLLSKPCHYTNLEKHNKKRIKMVKLMLKFLLYLQVQLVNNRRLV